VNASYSAKNDVLRRRAVTAGPGTRQENAANWDAVRGSYAATFRYRASVGYFTGKVEVHVKPDFEVPIRQQSGHLSRDPESSVGRCQKKATEDVHRADACQRNPNAAVGRQPRQQHSDAVVNIVMFAAFLGIDLQ